MHNGEHPQPITSRSTGPTKRSSPSSSAVESCRSPNEPLATGAADASDLAGESSKALVAST